MKIQVSVLWVAIDALKGSLSIKDGGVLFRFSEETRKAAAELLAKVADAASVNVEFGEDGKE